MNGIIPKTVSYLRKQQKFNDISGGKTDTVYNVPEGTLEIGMVPFGDVAHSRY